MPKLRICFMLLISVVWLSFPVQNGLLASGMECYTSWPINVVTETIDTQNADSFPQIAELQLENDINAFALTPNGDTLIITTSSNAQIYSLSENAIQLSFLRDCRPISEVAFSSDGTKVAVVDRDMPLIELWDVSTDSLLETINSTGERITSLTFSQTGDLLAWAVSDIDQIAGDPWIGNATVSVYDLEAHIQISRFQNVADLVTNLHFSPDEEMIVFRGSYPGYGFDMQVWDIESETRQAIREAWFVIPAYATNTPMVVLSSTTSLGITDEFSYQLEFWNIQTNSITRNTAVPRNPNRSSYAGYARIPAIALNTNASLLATGNDEGTIAIWNTSTGTVLTSFEAYSGQVQQLAFSRNDQYLISLGTDGTLQSIQIWGVSS